MPLEGESSKEKKSGQRERKTNKQRMMKKDIIVQSGKVLRLPRMPAPQHLEKKLKRNMDRLEIKNRKENRIQKPTTEVFWPSSPVDSQS